MYHMGNNQEREKMRKFTPLLVDQKGAVSIFSVIFFIIITSIITVGFIRVINIEQQQAIDNSSSANALAAARSGIEDGKRALLLAQRLSGVDASDPATGQLKSKLDTALHNESCNAILGQTEITNALGVTSSDGKVYKAGEDGGQYYTCLTINQFTSDYQNESQPNKSVIVPIKPEAGGDISRINLKWHAFAQDGTYTGIHNPAGNPASVGDFPSHMRLQLIAVPKGSFSVSQIESWTGFLNAQVLTQTHSGSPTDLTLDSDGASAYTIPRSWPVATLCKGGGAGGAEYACESNLMLPAPGFDMNSKDYYLRVTAIHKKAGFQVMMIDSTGSVVRFDGIQPTIDATGKSGDTFRRLRARVSFTAHVDLPENLVEAGSSDPGAGNICKNVKVSGSSVVLGCVGDL